MTTIDRTPTPPVDTRYIDPQGSIFELVDGDDEWTVTEHRTGRPTRVVASGPAELIDRGRQMLTTWADHEGGTLDGAAVPGEVVVIPAVTVPADFTARVAEARRRLDGLMEVAETIYRDLLPSAQPPTGELPGDGPHVLAELFGKITGWDALWDDMVSAAGALLVAAAARAGDLPYPEWIGDEDRSQRDTRDLMAFVTANGLTLEQVGLSESA